MDAGSETNLISDLANFAVVKNIGKTAKDTLHWLRSHRENWVMIFDNADDTSVNLGKYIPRCDHGNVIITTRNETARIHAGRLSRHSSSCDVSQMSLENAIVLFFTVCGLLTDGGKQKTIAGSLIEVK